MKEILVIFLHGPCSRQLQKTSGVYDHLYMDYNSHHKFPGAELHTLEPANLRGKNVTTCTCFTNQKYQMYNLIRK